MGQSYYGKNNLGWLRFINDSTAVADFLGLPYNPLNKDTCKVSSIGDTLFLTTKATWLYKVYLYTEPVEKHNIEYLESANLYTQSLIPHEWCDATMAGWYDSVHKMHYIECFYVFQKNYFYIVVLSHLEKYSRVAFYSEKTSCYLTIGIEQNPLYYDGWTGIILDHFPLLVKGNRLVPCCDLKQVQCWVDNGFFFPIMKKGQPGKSFVRIPSKYRGMQNLPYCDIPAKKTLPKKYFDYFYNEDNMQYFPAVIEENTQKDTVR